MISSSVYSDNEDDRSLIWRLKPSKGSNCYHWNSSTNLFCLYSRITLSVGHRSRKFSVLRKSKVVKFLKEVDDTPTW